VQRWSRLAFVCRCIIDVYARPELPDLSSLTLRSSPEFIVVCNVSLVRIIRHFVKGHEDRLHCLCEYLHKEACIRHQQCPGATLLLACLSAGWGLRTPNNQPGTPKPRKSSKARVSTNANRHCRESKKAPSQAVKHAREHLLLRAATKQLPRDCRRRSHTESPLRLQHHTIANITA
jgi:hypothetical protein